MKTISLEEYNPIIEIRENLIYCNNGNLILAYKADLPEIYSLSEKDLEDMHSTWFQSLKSLPTGIVLHKQDVFKKKEFTSENIKTNTYLGKATNEHFKGRDYLEHESYLFFILTKNKHLNNPSFANPFRPISKSIVREMDLNAEEFIKNIHDSVSFLNNSKKMNFLPLSQEEILKQTHLFFNGQKVNANTDIILDDEINIGDNKFDIYAINNENCFGGGVSTSKKNEKFTSDDFVFHQGFIDGIGLSLNENHIVNQIIYLDDKHKWRKLLDKKREELMKSTNFGTQNKVIQTKIEEILEHINTDDNARVIRGHFNVIYWGKKNEDLKRIANKLETEFKELDIVPYYPKGETKKKYFLNSYFGFSSNFANEDLYVTDLKHALCLFVNNTAYKTDEKGVLFNDREYNIPVRKDIWDEKKKRIKARNFAIYAPTGEGKSFLANNILRQYFEDDVRLVIIDLGGSYSKFAKLYPDDHIILRYEAGKNLGINPFYVSENEIITAERIEDLMFFMFELLGVQNITKTLEVSLKKILIAYFKATKTNHSLSSLYDFVNAGKDTLHKELDLHKSYLDLENFLLIISEYVGDGLYSFLFEVTEDQSYKIEDKKLIIFELDEVKDNKEILSVMLKLIKTAIQRTIWRNKEERGVILFDEFAKQLKFDGVLSSVEFYYQAIRKQNGAIGIILQSINQLPDNSTSASILENTQIIYSLNNEKGYAEIVRRLNLSSHDLNQLKSIKNNLVGKRKYTEFFLKIGKESNIYRLEVPYKVFAAYLTDGVENEKIMRLFEKSGNMETAIEEFIAT